MHLVEYVDHAVYLVTCDRQRRLDLHDIAQARVAPGPEPDGVLEAQVVHPFRFLASRLLGRSSRDELDRGEEAGTTNVTHERVSVLDVDEPSRQVLAHRSGGSDQSLLLEDL